MKKNTKTSIQIRDLDQRNEIVPLTQGDLRVVTGGAHLTEVYFAQGCGAQGYSKSDADVCH